MIITNYVKRIAESTGVRLVTSAMLVMSFITNLVLGAVILSTNRDERIVITPQTLDKSFWVQGNKLSPEYIEQMGNYVTQLMLNITPSTVQYQGRMLLAITDPKNYMALKKRIALTEAILNRDQISTFFSGKQVYSEASKYPNRVAFGGILYTVMSDKKVVEFAKTYMAEFGVVAGKTTVIDFRETNDRDPLGIQPVTIDEAKEALMDIPAVVFTPPKAYEKTQPVASTLTTETKP